jgi:hypothetical protein
MVSATAATMIDDKELVRVELADVDQSIEPPEVEDWPIGARAG